MLIVIKLLISVVLLMLSVIVYADNLGHRLGKKLSTTLPENSVELYNTLIEATDQYQQIKYIEFDVRELKTGELIVFHDATFKKGLRQHFKKKVSDTAYDEIKHLCLKKSTERSCYKIPRVKDILEVSKKLKRKKRVLIELKKISDKGKNKLIDLMNRYKEQVDMGIIISVGRFDKLFSKKWCLDFNRSGYSIMQTHRKKDPNINNLCEKFN